jgi:hypothetical protein
MNIILWTADFVIPRFHCTACIFLVCISLDIVHCLTLPYTVCVLHTPKSLESVHCLRHASPYSHYLFFCCEIWDSHSVVDEDSSLQDILLCLLCQKFLTFQRTVVTSVLIFHFHVLKSLTLEVKVYCPCAWKNGTYVKWSIAPPILNLGTISRAVVCVMHQPLYSLWWRSGIHWTKDYVDPGISLDILDTRKISGSCQD